MSKITKYIIKVLVSISLLAYLLSKLSLSLSFSLLLEVNLVFLLPVILLLFCQIALSSWKWYIILKTDKIFAPYKFLLKSYFIGNFISLFLPSSFGGDLYRIYALKQYNLGVIKNTSSVLFDRLTGLFALLSISFLSYTIFNAGSIQFNFLLLYLILIFLFLSITSDRSIKYFQTYTSKVISGFVSILTSFNRYRQNRSSLSGIFLLSFIFQHNIIWIVFLYCMSLGIAIDLKYLYVVVPLIYLTEALPISINGLGVREGAFVFFFLQAGHSSEEAFAVSMLVILMRYLFSMTVGGSLLLIEIFSSKPRAEVMNSKY